MPPEVTFGAIIGFRLITAAPQALAAFYQAIGFSAGVVHPVADNEIRMLGLDGAGQRLRLTLGASHIDLDWFDRPGRRYPVETNAADLVFQHLALVTDDAHMAWARALAAGASPISRDGPKTLPESAGGVTAVKFRDPDGHPLEFLQFPPDSNPAWRGSGILGIDHSAISVSDIAASRRFYEQRGLAEDAATFNQGPTQVALDGLDDVRVDVVPMNPETRTPHVELLGYRNPRPRSHAPFAANDVAATRILWRADRDALLRDPDGHLHQLTR